MAAWDVMYLLWRGFVCQKRVFFPPGRDALQWANVQVHRWVLKKIQPPHDLVSKGLLDWFKKRLFFPFVNIFCSLC